MLIKITSDEFYLQAILKKNVKYSWKFNKKKEFSKEPP